MELEPSAGQAGTLDLFLVDTHANRGVEPRVVHSSRGRLRLHLPLWTGKLERQIEKQLAQLPGVHSAQANAVTGNVLLVYAATVTSANKLLDAVKTLRLTTR